MNTILAIGTGVMVVKAIHIMNSGYSFTVACSNSTSGNPVYTITSQFPIQTVKVGNKSSK